MLKSNICVLSRYDKWQIITYIVGGLALFAFVPAIPFLLYGELSDFKARSALFFLWSPATIISIGIDICFILQAFNVILHKDVGLYVVDSNICSNRLSEKPIAIRDIVQLSSVSAPFQSRLVIKTKNMKQIYGVLTALNCSGDDLARKIKEIQV